MKNKYVTIAICSHFVPSYGMSTEKRIWFRRGRFLTANGVQRMLNNGCEETDWQPMPCYSVMRVERMTYF